MKVKTEEREEFAEVHFYLELEVGEQIHYVAVASFYGPPHQGLAKQSSYTYITMQHQRDSDVRVIDVQSIVAVVMLAPDPRYPLFFHDGSETDRWYLMQKPGLTMGSMIGIEEDPGDDDGTGG
jgi:hypothetical protein